MPPLLLYQIATFASASAKPWVAAKPIPALAPETIAVLSPREKGGRTRSFLGAIVLSVIAIKLSMELDRMRWGKMR